MRRATRIAAASFGVLAGLAGLEHGYYEILQGNIRPHGLMIVSIGPPCLPEATWNACEPAMTVLPSFLAAGIMTVIVSVVILIWSAAFVQRKRGGLVLMLLSGVLLLTGGGIFPPLIGIVGGATGTQINRPLPLGAPGSVVRFAEKLWPWPLVVMVVWLLGQFPVGYFFNDFLMSVMGFGLILILAMLPLTVLTAYARDAVRSRPEKAAG